MTQGAEYEALASRLGERLSGAMELHPPQRIEGVDLGLTLRPADGEALGRCLATLEELGAAALVRGGGSRLGLANLPERADCLLDTRSLDALDTFDAEEGVVHAGAGVSLASVRSVVEPEGWELSLDAWGAGSTLGGVLSAAAFGPRLLGLGPPRDAVLGLDVVLASGERTRCGGRVVKNVTGYDLAKLYVGAFGTLGVIEGAWLRLRPLPEEKARVVAIVENLEAAHALGLEVARRPTARCSAVVAPRALETFAVEATGAQNFLLVVELAGDRPAVESDLAWLADRASLERPTRDAMEQLAALQGGPGRDVRARLAVLPSAVPRCASELGSSLLCFHPGTGLVYAGSSASVGRPAAAAAPLGAASEGGADGGATDLSDIVDRIDRAATLAGASLLFEVLPLELRRERDVFGDAGPERRLMVALKDRFDPSRVLNPGRFQGGV